MTIDFPAEAKVGSIVLVSWDVAASAKRGSTGFVLSRGRAALLASRDGGSLFISILALHMKMPRSPLLLISTAASSPFTAALSRISSFAEYGQNYSVCLAVFRPGDSSASVGLASYSRLRWAIRLPPFEPRAVASGSRLAKCFEKCFDRAKAHLRILVHSRL
jgi:hypothetical protein